MSGLEEKPRLRNVDAFVTRGNSGPVVCMRDPTGIFSGYILVSVELFHLVIRFLDGEHSVLDIQTEIARESGQIVPSADIQRVIASLDEAYLLESDRFRAREAEVRREFLEASERPPSHAGGAYKADPDELIREADDLYRVPGAAADEAIGAAELLGVVAPHIDFARGGRCYTWAYRDVARNARGETFVILGTCHSPMDLHFALTRKAFVTPLGRAPVDIPFVERLESAYDGDLYHDEFHHRGEHSIEFQVVMLQHALGRPFSIVPILIGSFSKYLSPLAPVRSPREDPAVDGFIRALRDAAGSAGAPVVFVAAADLAHVGPRFGDREPLSESLLEEVRRADLRLLAHVEAGDAEGFFREMAADGDRRRICGWPAIYTLMHLLDGKRSRLLLYDQAADFETQQAVTFSSLRFPSTPDD